MPQKPDEKGGQAHDDLPEIDDPTDLLELLQDFDPEAAEPIGELPMLDPRLNAEPDIELLSTEPEGTLLADGLPRTEGLLPTVDDLQDFATQEEIPILPWRLQAELLEIGHSLPAVLDPTLKTSRWERPAPQASRRLTIRLRMVVVAVQLTQVQAEHECLRVGRDVLAGRALILVE